MTEVNFSWAKEEMARMRMEKWEREREERLHPTPGPLDGIGEVLWSVFCAIAALAFAGFMLS